MQQEQLRRVPIWSPGLRACHWLLALSTLGMMATAWLMSASAELYHWARDYHFLFAYVLSGALLYRLYLLLMSRASDHYLDCLPIAENDLKKMPQMLKFYLSRGKFELPAWFAHNPLWGPVYLVVFGALTTLMVSGFVMEYSYDSLASALHSGAAVLINFFVLLHIVAVFMHDWKSENSDISAMISGYKIFRDRKVDTSSIKPAGQPITFFRKEDL